MHLKLHTERLLRSVLFAILGFRNINNEKSDTGVADETMICIIQPLRVLFLAASLMILLFLSFRFRGATIFPNLVGLLWLVVESRE